MSRELRRIQGLPFPASVKRDHRFNDILIIDFLLIRGICLLSPRSCFFSGPLVILDIGAPGLFAVSALIDHISLMNRFLTQNFRKRAIEFLICDYHPFKRIYLFKIDLPLRSSYRVFQRKRESFPMRIRDINRSPIIMPIVFHEQKHRF